VTPANGADFSKPGPFAIGFQEFAIPDATGEPLQTYVWYPAIGPAPDDAASIRSTPDAPPATTGPYPLVVLISGLTMRGTTYSRWGELLASHGFVAFASTYDYIGGGGIGPRLLYRRPADVVRVIGYADTLTASNGKLAGLIDTSHIGVWGMSTGGTTALQAGGARIDFKALNEWCAANEAERNGESCQFIGQESSTATLYGVPDPFAQPLPPIWDSRVAALVLASPGGELQVFGAAGIAAVKVPTLVMVASDDSMVKPELNGLWAYDGIGSKDKALAIFDKGGHALFVGLGPHVAQAVTLTIAFFRHVLKGDPAGKAAVLTDAVSFSGLSYKTTLH
jgi:predicted dienelactone hydrolase